MHQKEKQGENSFLSLKIICILFSQTMKIITKEILYFIFFYDNNFLIYEKKNNIFAFFRELALFNFYVDI